MYDLNIETMHQEQKQGRTGSRTQVTRTSKRASNIASAHQNLLCYRYTIQPFLGVQSRIVDLICVLFRLTSSAYKMYLYLPMQGPAVNCQRREAPIARARGMRRRPGTRTLRIARHHYYKLYQIAGDRKCVFINQVAHCYSGSTR